MTTQQMDTCQIARNRDPHLECAPAGGRIGRIDLTPSTGLQENGSHDETPVP
jgi:hypothetical protein